MRRLLLAAAFALVTTPALAQAVCTSTQPGPTWVCVGGGWLPPGHPGIPAAPPTLPPVPPPNQPTPETPFLLNFRYTRGTTDVRIVGSGQVQGVTVLFALCNEVGDGCFYKGAIRMFLSNASAADWTDHGPY